VEPQARFVPNRGNPDSIELAASSLPRMRSNQLSYWGILTFLKVMSFAFALRIRDKDFVESVIDLVVIGDSKKLYNCRSSYVMIMIE